MPAERRVRRRDENEIEFSRIVAFSDGVFAIAITLLVLNLSVPEHLPGGDLNEALWDQRHALFAYALSFAVIGRFWLVHHRFFADVKAFDGRLIALNLFYLAWIVLIPFSSQVLGDHGGETAAVVLYSTNLAATILVGVFLFESARRAGLVDADPDSFDQGRRRALLTATIFLASIPVAFVNPHLATYLWLAMFIGPIRRGRRSSGGS